MMADETGAAAPEQIDQTTPEPAPEAGSSVSGGAQPAGTLLGSDPSEKPVAAPADWPDDWRTKVAGQDQKELQRLQRMGSPADVWKAYRALEAKLSSGQVKNGLPENPTEEELATWRKENGIPDKPDAYVPELGNGLVLGESDKPILEGFKQAAFEANMTPVQFNKALNWYYAQVDTFTRQQEEADVAYHTEAEDTLRKEWGGEYRQHVNAINNLTALAPEGVAERFLGGRTADGKKIGDDPGIIKWLAAVAREFNPVAPYVPVGSSNPMQAAASRIKEIESVMGTEAYWKNDAMQEEYRNLLAAQEKMQSRSAA